MCALSAILCSRGRKAQIRSPRATHKHPRVHKRTAPKSTRAKLELACPNCRAEPVDEPHNYCNVTMATKNTVALVCISSGSRGANTKQHHSGRTKTPAFFGAIEREIIAHKHNSIKASSASPLLAFRVRFCICLYTNAVHLVDFTTTFAKHTKQHYSLLEQQNRH